MMFQHYCGRIGEKQTNKTPETFEQKEEEEETKWRQNTQPSLQYQCIERWMKPKIIYKW